MDVELYVYDLSQGLARQVSRQYLGIQIDAVYHTSLVFDGIEYYFGQGVLTCKPGTTHHGRPMEIVPMGRTELPHEVILEFLDSLRLKYTPESYDLFAHNCNNFTNDFARFLVGRPIPDHISSLPRTVLDTPFGRMLRPQLDSAMRGITQGGTPPPAPAPSRATTTGSAPPPSAAGGAVRTASSLGELDALLAHASSSCAIVFFTSTTCPPCKVLYPVYDALAAEAGARATLIKADVGAAPDIARRYAVRATPTFATFLRGARDETWSGADAPRLRAALRALLHAAFPPHAHTNLPLPALRRAAAPVAFAKPPPLAKLVARLGPVVGADPVVAELVAFLAAPPAAPTPAPAPDMPRLARFLQGTLAAQTVAPADLFALYDLVRPLVADGRTARAFAAGGAARGALRALLQHAAGLAAGPAPCPYSLRLVACQMGANAVAHGPAVRGAVADTGLGAAAVALAGAGLLDGEHAALRAAAASLAFNVALACVAGRAEEGVETLAEEQQVALAATLVEALGAEAESADAARGMVLALGWLVFGAPEDGEVRDLCAAMDAGEVVLGKKQLLGQTEAGRALLVEVGSRLLGAADVAK